MRTKITKSPKNNSPKNKVLKKNQNVKSSSEQLRKKVNRRKSRISSTPNKKISFSRNKKTPKKWKNKKILSNSDYVIVDDIMEDGEDDCVIVEPNLHNDIICIDCEEERIKEDDSNINDCTNNNKNVDENIENVNESILFIVDKNPGNHGTKVPIYETIQSSSPEINHIIDTSDDCIILDTDDSLIYCGRQEFENNKKKLSIIEEKELTRKEKIKNKKLAKLYKQIISLESATGSNFYNPNSGRPQGSKKRIIIIDGSNVAYAHANNSFFSAEGLQIAIRFFEKIGHETKAIVPQYRLKAQETSNQTIMMNLQKEGKLVTTPAKNLPGHRSSSYDDRFILQIANEFDAAVISNDNYRDLVNENSNFRNIITTRVIGYTWFKDMFVVPTDPYGRQGPTLQQILNYTD